MKRTLISSIVCSLAFTLNGCGGGDPDVSVVDLDKVLDVFEKVLNQPAPGGAVAANGANPAKPGEKPEVKPLEAGQEDARKTAAFLTKLADALNTAKILEKDHIGVQMLASGAIEGFIDENKDRKKAGVNEKKLFTVEIDVEKSRLIATDDSGQGSDTYRRDRRYRSGGGGFFMGYMLGSMMGRQNRYYTGGRARPGYGSMSMNKRGYHSNAVSSARTKAKNSGRSYSGRSTGRSSGARSGGSRSFRGGK